MMTEDEKSQRRGWCIDYALRVSGAHVKTVDEIIADAKKFENYILDKPRARILKLTKNRKKK
jgi:hypothetical protein